MMTQTKIFELIAETLSIDVNLIKLETSIENELHIDSLGIVDLTLAFESELDCDIPDEDVVKMKIVKDIVDYIQNK